MGPALWVFLWLWREARLPEGDWFGEVRNCQPIRLEEIAGDLGIPVRTVKRHVATLREAEYLETWKSGREGLEFMVFLWDPEVDNASENGANKTCGAKNGPTGIVPVVPKMAPQTSEATSEGPKMAPRNSCGESVVPKMAPQNPPRPPYKDLSISRSPSSSGESSYVAAARGFITNASVETDQEPEREAVAAGHSPATPGLARARELLTRVEAWERPDLTHTLSEKLARLEPEQVDQAFEFVWRRHRHRNKGLASPAAWWASMLARAADELAQDGP